MALHDCADNFACAEKIVAFLNEIICYLLMCYMLLYFAKKNVICFCSMGVEMLMNGLVWPIFVDGQLGISVEERRL